MQTKKGVAEVVAFVVETLFPLAVFVVGVAYGASTFTLAALLIIPLLLFLDYFVICRHLTKSGALLDFHYVLLTPLSFPPLYVIVHHVGLGMFLLVFNDLTLLQQVLLGASFVLSHNFVASEGVRAFMKSQKLQEDDVATITTRGLWYLFLITLAALFPLGVALYTGKEWLAVAMLVSIYMLAPHLPLLPRIE